MTAASKTRATRRVTRAGAARQQSLDGLREALSRAIAEHIKEKGLSQTEAAALTGDARSQMSLAASGHVRGFSVERLLRILSRLGNAVEIRVDRTPHPLTRPKIAVRVRRWAEDDGAFMYASAKVRGRGV